MSPLLLHNVAELRGQVGIGVWQGLLLSNARYQRYRPPEGPRYSPLLQLVPGSGAGAGNCFQKVGNNRENKGSSPCSSVGQEGGCCPICECWVKGEKKKKFKMGLSFLMMRNEDGTHSVGFKDAWFDTTGGQNKLIIFNLAYWKLKEI